MLKPKYKLSERPVVTFSLSGGNSPVCPLLVTPLAIIYCIYIQQAVPTQLQEDESWWRSLVYWRACKLSN